MVSTIDTNDQEEQKKIWNVSTRVARCFLFKPKIPIWVNLGGPYVPRVENVDTIHSHLEYFTDIWDILGPFGTFYSHWVHFPGFGILCQEKSGNPGLGRKNVVASWERSI
jgi:hypothetical protein